MAKFVSWVGWEAGDQWHLIAVDDTHVLRRACGNHLPYVGDAAHLAYVREEIRGELCSTCTAELQEIDRSSEAFFAVHGYPPGVDRAWLAAKVANAEKRLMALTAMRAPHVIVEGEKRLIAKFKQQLAAWDTEHTVGDRSDRR